MMAPLGMIAGIAGTAFSALGAIQQGRAQAAAAEQQAAMADFQREQLEIKANEEFAAAQREASYEKRKKDLLLSTARARAGGSGFDPKSSDYLRNEEDIASAGDYHRAMLLYGGASRQQGLREQGALTGMEASSLRQSAGSYRTAGLIGGLGNAFSGISTMARYRF